MVGVAGLVIALLGFGLSTAGSDTRLDSTLEDGDRVAAPGFDLEELSGGSFSSTKLERTLGRAGQDGSIALEELRGVPIVLNFWASWCGPCRDEAPLLERSWQAAQRRDTLYLGLNTQDLSTDAEEFIGEFSVSYPTVRDPGRDVSGEYGLTGLPETFFIDRSGRVVGHAVGIVDERILALGERRARTGETVGVIRGGALGARR